MKKHRHRYSIGETLYRLLEESGKPAIPVGDLSKVEASCKCGKRKPERKG